MNFKLTDVTTEELSESGDDEVITPTWVYEDGNGKQKISCPTLADHIRDTADYIFAYDDARGLKEIYLYQHGVYVLQSEDDFKGFIKEHIPRALYRSGIVDEVFKDLKTDTSGSKHFVNRAELNTDEDIVNYQNGIFHHSTQTLTPHNPKYLSTIQLPLNRKPVEQCEKGIEFEKFILYHLGNDEEQVKLMMEFIGVALSNINASRMKKALFVVGKGNTGKSILKDLTIRLLGEHNSSPIELSDLEQRFGTGTLYQKRLAGCNDMSCMRLDELSNFKKLTGGDIISAEFKGKPHFTFKFKGLMWFCANEPPLFGGDKGDWVYDRICIVKPTGRVYSHDTPYFDGIVYRDPHLIDKLWEEREYIVSCAMKAVKGVIERGYQYSITDKNKSYLTEYRTENSSTLTFLEECCEPRSKNGKQKYDKCTKAMLYKVYIEWCKTNSGNGYKDSKRNFKKAIESVGKGNKVTVHGNEYYTDFTLTEKAKKEFRSVYGLPT